MKKYLALLLVLILSHTAHAEYESLTQLKDKSRQDLRSYAEQFCNVDPKYEGIVRFGEALRSIEDVGAIDIDRITIHNKDYWRAVMEMTPSNPSVLFAHAHLHIAKGEVARGETYLLLGGINMDAQFMDRLQTQLKYNAELVEQMSRDIQKGMQHHDKGEYDRALAVYDHVIAEYPGGAWAHYEKGFSYLMMGPQEPELIKKREAMYAACRERDPFYTHAYQGSGEGIVDKFIVMGGKVHPFTSGERRDFEAFLAYAEGCEELGLFHIAAHARWKLAQIDTENLEVHLKKFLDLLEPAGCKDADFIRSQFKFKDDDAQVSEVSE